MGTIDKILSELSKLDEESNYYVTVSTNSINKLVDVFVFEKEGNGMVIKFMGTSENSKQLQDVLFFISLIAEGDEEEINDWCSIFDQAKSGTRLYF